MKLFENIPQELKRLKQWVVTLGGSKVPVNARTCAPASSSNPSTWSTYDDAIKCVEHGATYLGFVFADNGFVGIDIDAGWDHEGFMTPEAADIIGACASYTEKSRSGRGFHIILKGELPFKGRNNRKGVEIYKEARYFITTGDVLLYRDIMENQNAIDYVVKTYFPDYVKENEEGRKFSRIYSPQWELPQDGRVKLRPVYPRIPQGCRNICLTSLAGIMHSQGYAPQQIYDELCYANVAACEPFLEPREIETIVRSVIRYKR